MQHSFLEGFAAAGSHLEGEGAEVRPSVIKSEIHHVRVGGMDVAAISNAELIDCMLSDAPRRRAEGDRPLVVFDVNAHGISLFANDPAFRANAGQADILHADGQIVVAASRLFCTPAVPDRSATTDMFFDSLKPANAARVSYYLLGAMETVNAECAQRVERDFPGFVIAGRRNGYFGDDEDSVVDAINAVGADVLWVGLGKPMEQDFCVRNRDRLNVGWIVTCGGLFNYVTGAYPRAPRWMQNVGLEWLHRMATNPRALFVRYATTNPHALWRIWKLRNENSADRSDLKLNRIDV